MIACSRNICRDRGSRNNDTTTEWFTRSTQVRENDSAANLVEMQQSAKKEEILNVAY